MSSIPDFIHRRWNDNVEAGRLLSRKLSTSHSRIKKTIQKAKKVKVESKMKWKRTLGTVKAINGRWMDRMEAELNATRESGIDIPHNTMGKYREMSKHAIELDSNFASHMTFYNWVDGKRKTVLTKSMTSVIESMYKIYVKNNQHCISYDLFKRSVG